MPLKIAVAAANAGAALVIAIPATATTGKGFLFHDGAVVGTVVVPANVPAGSGTDPFYNVTNGAAGQLGIAGVAPGDGPYHGGDWQGWPGPVQDRVPPSLLPSDGAVVAAHAGRGGPGPRAP